MLHLARPLMLVFAAFSLLAGSASAEKQYGPGVSDREIKIGNIMPYSGPASAYSIVGKTMSAYFRMINDNGGINGRRITFISYDDAYSPPKTVEQARKLVESDEVFLIFAPLGTATNAANQKYMNTMRVPQLFVLRGASRWADPGHLPWTIGLQPNYRAEARVYAAYILEHYPNARIGVLYQNDDFGRDYILGLKDCERTMKGWSSPVRPMKPAHRRWTRRLCRSGQPVPIFSSISRRRNLPLRRSRRSPSSIGIPSIS